MQNSEQRQLFTFIHTCLDLIDVEDSFVCYSQLVLFVVDFHDNTVPYAIVQTFEVDITGCLSRRYEQRF